MKTVHSFGGNATQYDPLDEQRQKSKEVTGGKGANLVEMAAESGRVTRPDIKLGICCEHGGDPVSIAFCEEIRLDYIGVSPYRVPIARLAAAQAALALD